MASSRGNPGCLIPFGLIFLLAGCVPGFIALHDLRTVWATQGWSETTATLLHLELQQGEDTASLDCRYRYRAPDPLALESGALKDYEGTRVGIHGGADNIGDWQLATFSRLEAAKADEEAVPCWYDPADPTQAVLDRGERWELIGFMLIFPLVFGLVGIGIMCLGVHLWRKSRRPAPTAQTVIDADGGGGCAVWIIAIIWNAIAWAATIAVLSQTTPTPVLLLVALFPLIGLLLLWGAIQATLRRLRHGRPQLRLDAGAWTTGNRVRATLLTRTPPQPGDRSELALAVTRSVTSGSGDRRSTTTTTLWSYDLAPRGEPRRSADGRWELALELPLPSDLPPSDDQVSWKLTWQLIRPGPDLSAAFALLVTAGSPDVELKAADLAAAADRAAPLAVLSKAGISVSEERGEVVISLPAWRNRGLHLAGLIASAVLSAIAAALWMEIGWWTALLSAPILLLCWRGALRSALWSSRITLGSGRLAISAGWWRQDARELKASEITEVERRSSMSSGQVKWFNMWLRTADGERLPIVRGVPGPAADRLAEMLSVGARAPSPERSAGAPAREAPQD